MATILYYSDIHIEIREQEGGTGWTSRYPLALGPDLRAHAGRADLLVLAGDIGRMRSRRNVSTLAYAAQAAEYLGCPALVVPGNHEYYRGSFDEEREALLAAKLEGVTVIDRGEAHYPIGGRMLRVLGATLWTDYAANGDFFEAIRRAQDTMEDHRLISPARRRRVPASGRARGAPPVARLARGAPGRAARRADPGRHAPRAAFGRVQPEIGHHAALARVPQRLRRADRRRGARQGRGLDLRPSSLVPRARTSGRTPALGAGRVSGRGDRLGQPGLAGTLRHA